MFKDFLYPNCPRNAPPPRVLCITGTSVLILQPPNNPLVKHLLSLSNLVVRLQSNRAPLLFPAGGYCTPCVTGCGKYVQVPGSPQPFKSGSRFDFIFLAFLALTLPGSFLTPLSEFPGPDGQVLHTSQACLLPGIGMLCRPCDSIPEMESLPSQPELPQRSY